MKKFVPKYNTCVETYTGVLLDLANPKPKQIRIADIVHGLSVTCRWGGQCGKFYSVAEHSLLVASMVVEKFKLWALLHDAAEAYMGDVTNPLKRMVPEYSKIENRLLDVILKKFGMDWPLPNPIKINDMAAQDVERAYLMASCDWQFDPYPGWFEEQRENLIKKNPNACACLLPKEIEKIYGQKIQLELMKKGF